MKIALSAQESSPDGSMDPRFGRAKYFIVYDTETAAFSTIDNAQNLQAAQGAGIQAAATVVNADCGTVITGHCGPKAFAALSKAGVTVYAAVNGTVRESVEAFGRGELRRLEGADVDGHW